MAAGRVWINRLLVAAFGVFAVGAVEGQPYVFTTLAGDSGTGHVDGTGNGARFNNPAATAVDGSANIYVADRSNHTIRRITAAGVVTTVAGLAGHSGSANGNGASARFRFPSGLAIDPSGNLYVVDNNTVRRITLAGVVTTLAGAPGIPGSTNGPGADARFQNPNGIAVDSEGDLIVADSSNNTIRRITPGLEVTTLAGTPGVGGSSVDATGTLARFNGPTGVAIDSLDNIFVADTLNHTIRKVTPDGVVTTFAGTAGIPAYLDATGDAARFNLPSGVSIDGADNLYVTELGRVRRITPGRVVTTLAGAASTGYLDATGTAARFGSITGPSTDGSDNVYVAESFNQTIRKITSAGVVSTVAGLAIPSGSTDATGSNARFLSPGGVTVDGNGDIFVADSGNLTIRKITPAGVVTTFAGLAGSPGSTNAAGTNARFRSPVAIAADAGGNLYVADQVNHTVRKITSGAVVSTLAGSPLSPGTTNANGGSARFNNPAGVAVDSDDNVYVADRGNHTIRMITPAGDVTTPVGLAGSPGNADGTGSVARFRYPTGLAIDGDDNIYVADQGDELFGSNHTIRKIAPGGVVTTLAGLAGTAGSDDGAGTAARFQYPAAVAVDSGGNFYVADRKNSTIRRITPAGVVTTLGGLVEHSSYADGTGSAARFNNPAGLVAAGSTLYIADRDNHLIRVGKTALSDAATIDASTGLTGIARQLSTSPNTAATWQWSVLRRPRTSTAALSSTTLRNPTFTPDVPNLYTFRLVASNGSSTSITTVDLYVSAVASPPATLSATAATPTSVGLSWPAAAGAASYQIGRRTTPGGTFDVVGSSAGTAFTDTSASAGKAYLYEVRALDGTGEPTAYGPADLATTVMFDDDPLVANVTVAKAVHVTQLRTAVEAVRALAGLAPATYTDTVLTAMPIKAAHVTDLRTALNAARVGLSLLVPTYTDPGLAAGTLVRSAHLGDLRNGVK